MKKKLSFFLAAACVAAWPAHGQTPVAALTLKDAEALALKNHPHVLTAEDEASAASHRITEARSAYFPTLSGEATGSQANQLARLGAGDLAASRLWNRLGQGIEVSQLVTDSGRTNNLVASSKLEAQARQQTYQATRYDILLGVERTYFDALRAQAVVRVSNETVVQRQTLFDQVNTLANNKLRSQLDVSFAGVSLSEAKLMMIRAQGDLHAAYANLSRALGSDRYTEFQLSEETLPGNPPEKPDDLIAQAFSNRPELVGARLQSGAAHRFERAEQDLSRPTVTVDVVAGFLPLVNNQSRGEIANEYESAAVNVNIPIFNGHLFSARRQVARYQALGADQQVRDLEQRISQEVRVAWAESITAFQRIDVTAQMMREASLGLDLAQERYNLGLSSIVELTQAQLSVTQAEVEHLSAKYDYQSQYAGLQYALGLLR